MSFIVKAVKGIVKGIVNVVKSVVKAIGNVISAVIDFVASPFLSLFGSPGGVDDASEAARQQGILIQQQGSNISIPVVYGYRKLAGAVTYAETGSTENKYLWVAYTFAEGTVEGLREIFLDDNQLPAGIIANLNAGQTVDVAEGKYSGRVKLQWFPGTFYANPSDSPVGTRSILADAPSWKTTMHHNGLAVLFARYEWKEVITQDDADNNPFGGGIPVVQISMLGRRVAALTTSASESVTYGGAGYTERYSINPAEILLDYLRNPRYGKGLSNGEIEWGSFRTAAQKANQTVTYITGITGPILTTNTVLDTGQTLFNNTKILLANFRAYLPYVQGKYKLKIEDAGDPNDITSGVATIVKTFTKDNLTGNITYTGIDRNSKYNHVVINYVDPDQKWSVQQVVYPETETERQTFIAVDGGRENKTEITFSGLTNYAIAKDMARLVFNKSRYQDTVSFTGDSSCLELEPGDNVYIDANILKFGTDPNAGAIPWRIVSIKLNNNFTFEIGAVRNPDFIYPHTRVGEIDKVSSTYIPKGATIYYPNDVVITAPPIGIVPPTTVVVPVDPITEDPIIEDPVSHPPPSQPLPEDPVAPIINNPPPPPPPVLEPTDYVTIDNLTFSNNAAILRFAQPQSSLYKGIDIWYKRNVASEIAWSRLENLDKPGANKNIYVTINNLIVGQTYSVKTRVKYTSGESSKFVGSINFTHKASGSIDPVDYQETAGAGWTLNETPAPNARNTFFSKIEASPVVSSTPRNISLTFTQDILNASINGNIAGFDIYYKASTATYWSYTRQDFGSDYVEGASYTINPLSISLGTPGQPDKYDFIIRFRYTDATVAKTQYRVMNCDVELNAFAATSYNIFYGVTPQAQGREDITAYTFITVDNAPKDAVVDSRTFTISVDTSYSLAFTSPVPGIGFVIRPPNDPSNEFLGLRLYTRNIESGASGAYSLRDFSPITKDAYGRYIIKQPISFNQKYEYILVALVIYNGEKVEATNCWAGKGAINTNLNADGTYVNWWEVLGFKSIPTATALSQINTALPVVTNPVIQVKGWSRVQADSSGAKAHLSYYRLEYNYSHIPTFQRLIVYRRTNNLQSGVKGKWEKLELVYTDASKTIVINLRLPIDSAEYSSQGVTSSLWATNKPLANPNTRKFEYLLVVKTTTLTSTQGLLLPEITKVPLTKSIDGLKNAYPTEVALTNIDLTDQRSNVSLANLVDMTVGRTPLTFTYPTPADGYTIA